MVSSRKYSDECYVGFALLLWYDRGLSVVRGLIIPEKSMCKMVCAATRMFFILCRQWQR
jgi:hypothetical protein